jgi:hypothetical protein
VTDLLHGGATIPDVVPHVWRRRDYLRAYVGPNWQEYAGVFDAMAKKDRLVFSWSWSIFLVSWQWMVYRRRYSWAISQCILIVAVQYLIRGSLALAISFLIWSFFAAYGKALYVRSALADIDRAHARTNDQHQRVEHVVARGGVSNWPTMVVACVSIALFILQILFPFGIHWRTLTE